MKVIYNHILYTPLHDDGEGLFLAEGLHVPYGCDRLIVDPTDDQVAALPTPYPVYTRHSSMPQPGLYLALFHGSYGLDRESRTNRFEDWGFQGPVIGPLEWVHTTYANHVKFRFTDEAAAELYRPWLNDGVVWMGQDQELMVGVVDHIAEIKCADCMIFAGDCFGDWTVFNHPTLK